MVGLSQTSKRVSTGFYGLSRTCGGGYMGYKWSVTDVRVSVCWLWMVCHKREKEEQSGIVGLSLWYKIVFMGGQVPCCFILRKEALNSGRGA